MIGVIQEIVSIVANSVNGRVEGSRDEDPVESFAAANVRGSVRLVGVQIGEGVIQVAGSADGCHQCWIVANDFVEVAKDDDIAADGLFVLNNDGEVIDALLSGVGVVVAGKTKELPLLSEDSSRDDVRDVSVNNIVEAEDGEKGAITTRESGLAPTAKRVRRDGGDGVTPVAKDGKDGAPQFPGGRTADGSGAGDEHAGAEVKFAYVLDFVVYVPV